jgi:hypothetical protein
MVTCEQTTAEILDDLVAQAEAVLASRFATEAGRPIADSAAEMRG